MDESDPANLEPFFQEGMDARMSGRRLADNPYPVRTVEHREWVAGWQATCDLDEDDDPQSSRVKPGLTDNDAETSDDGA